MPGCPVHVRLALESDLAVGVELAQAVATETRPDRTFNEERLRKTFDSYLRRASPTIWVAEHEDEIVGFLVAEFYEHRAFDGLFTTQEVMFVKPGYRGTRAAALLICQLIDWSRMLGATEILGGNDNAFQSDRTARFLEKFGFRRVGYAMRREV